MLGAFRPAAAFDVGHELIQVGRFLVLAAEQQIKRAVPMDQTNRRPSRFGGTRLSSDDQPSRTNIIVLAILTSPFKSNCERAYL
jgi:hypothetical protein